MGQEAPQGIDRGPGNGHALRLASPFCLAESGGLALAQSIFPSAHFAGGFPGGHGLSPGRRADQRECGAGGGADLWGGFGGGLSGGFPVQCSPHPCAGHPADLLRRGPAEFGWGGTAGVEKTLRVSETRRV